MTHILILGAGRSATDLISYLLDLAPQKDWKITVGDFNKDLAVQKVNGHSHGEAIFFDVNDEELVEKYVGSASIVASFLPAHMHVIVAQSCLKHKAHMVTASYITKEMKALDEEAKEAGLILLNEMGADPGLDHMSAMQQIDAIKAKGGKIISFKSYTGALIAPRSNDNPWGYKFTWAPMNVILAGQGGTARYVRDNKFRYLPYHRLFSITDTVAVPGAYGELEAYANRDSLPYRAKYNLEEVPTLIRGTLRVKGYCEAWNALVQLGLTDHSYKIERANESTYAEWLNAYLPYKRDPNLEVATAQFLDTELFSPLMERLRYLGLFSDQKIPLEKASPAEILLDLLSKKWVFKTSDTDLLVMVHEFGYELNGKTYLHKTGLAYEGLDHEHTAISRTVGLPAGIAIKLILEGVIQTPGAYIPVREEVYAPVLAELDEIGIHFEEVETEVVDFVP
jgi:saccharopine dehydrogenase (NADP+, L-glutamate forming)